MAAQRLPAEVLKRIIAFAVNAYEEWARGIGGVINRHALGHGLVARDWLEPSRQVALHDLYLSEPTVEIYSLAEEDESWLCGPFPRKLASLCVHQPERLKHLCRLEILMPVQDLPQASIYDSFLTLVGLQATGLIALRICDAHNLSPFAAKALGKRSIESFMVTWAWTGDPDDARPASVNRARPDGGLLAALLDGPTRISLRRLDTRESLHDGVPVMLSAMNGRELSGLVEWSIEDGGDLWRDYEQWAQDKLSFFSLRAPLLTCFRPSSAVLEWIHDDVQFLPQVRYLSCQWLLSGLHRFISLRKAVFWSLSTPGHSIALYELPASTIDLTIMFDDKHALEGVKTWLFQDYDRSQRRLERFEISGKASDELPQWLQDFCTQRHIELVWPES